MSVCRRLVAAALAAALIAPATGMADDNIYAGGLKVAERHLARAQERVAEATSDKAAAVGRLPSLQARVSQLDVAASRRGDHAQTVRQDADFARSEVLARRRDAAERVAEARSRDQARLSDWRSGRVGWIALTLALCALALLAPAAGLLARARTATAPTGRALPARVATALGAFAATYPAALVVALRSADAFVFSWTAVGAAVGGVAAAALTTAVAWRRPSRIRRLAPRLGHTAVPVVLLAAAAVAPAAVAASADRPPAARLGARTVALADEHRTRAALSSEVSDELDRAARLEHAAAKAQAAANDAAQELADAENARDDAQRRIDSARAAVAHWTAKATDAQRRYDRYQAFLTPDPPDDDAGPDEPSLPDPSLPDVPLPDVPTPSPAPSLPDPGYGPPTTEDFGNGQGSIGACADGTLSDSIGRPGACSHHGGVG